MRGVGWRTGRVVVLLTSALLAGCTGGAPEAPPPLVTPADPYGAFPYANAVQRSALQAFVRCAHEHGVDLDGPFADSRGKGVLFRLAEGSSASPAQQRQVDEACPQMLVGIFATPDHDRPLDLAAFRTALDGFSRCLRSEGLTRFPLPQVGENDPYRALEGLPIDWDDDSFVERAAACVDHLEEYVFAGPGGP